MFFLQGAEAPPLQLHAFIPWLALAALRYPLQKDFIKSLTGAAMVGLFVDLFSNDPIGLYAISYTLTTAILFQFRNRLDDQRPLHLAAFSAFTSLICSLLQLFFLFLFDRRVPISGQWILIDWFALSIIDGIYGFLWYSGPVFLWYKVRRTWMLFWLKKNRSHA